MLDRQDKKIAVWNSAAFVYTAAVAFISFTICINLFKPDVFGFYILISAILGIGTNLDLGFGISTVRNISESVKVNNLLNANKVFVSFSLVYFLIACITTTGFIAYYLLYVKYD